VNQEKDIQVSVKEAYSFGNIMKSI